MKFFGVIGFVNSEETKPDVYEEVATERSYYGDVTKNYKKWEASENLNDNININNSISIVADPFLYEHFFAIRYVEWMGTKWKVNNVEIQYPRLILSVGGVYNGPIANRA